MRSGGAESSPAVARTGAVYYQGTSMFAALAVILIIAWLLGFVVFHAAGGLIHVLLVIALVAFVWHFFTGRRTNI